MSTGRENFVLIALPNGKVLAAGGNPYPGLTSAELYDPISGTWSSTGSTEEGLQESEAVLLPSGKVFAFGNHEIYDPVMGTWSTAPSPAPSNQGTVDFMTLLQSGQVWVGNNDELFNPSASEWMNFGPPSCLISGRQDCGGGAALLANGQVLVAGGTKEVEISGAPDRRIQTHTLTTAVLWNPATQGWTSNGGLQVSRTGQSMTRLLNGQVLAAGGDTFNKSSGALVPIADAELYTP
jgi:hypothetical protein